MLAWLVLGTAGCQRQRVARDELVLLVEAPPRSADPRYLTVSYDYRLAALCFGRLVTVEDPQMLPRLDLAEAIELRTPPGQLPAEVDVRLRPARFSDGSEVGVEDLLYTMGVLLDPGTGHPVLKRTFADEGLQLPPKVVGPRTVRLVMAHPQASYRTDLGFGIVKRGSFEAGRPIGAGPFVLQGEVGEVTQLVRNPYYYGGAPPLARLTVRTVRDANSRLLSLVGGSADLLQNNISPLLFDAVKRWDSRLKIETAPSAILTYLGMNNEDPRLKDVRVRQALALALDRDRIVRTKLRGSARVATGMLPSFHWAYHGEVTRYQRDLAQAAKLLDEAGFPDPDGPGPKPRMTLTYKTSTDVLRVAIARVVAAQLGEVGIEVEVRPYEFHVFLQDLKKGNFQLFAMDTAEMAEPNYLMRFVHSRFIPTPENLDGGQNRVRYRSAELDRLLDAGQHEMDVARRRAVYAQVQEILARDLPLIPLWHADNVAVSRLEVQGYELLPSAGFGSLARVRK